MKTPIGDKILLTSLPKLIKVDSSFYILSKNSDNIPVLFNADCPHQHGIVEELCDDSWRCPNHDWTFDPKTGKCINAPQSKLEFFPVIIEDTKLFVDLPTNKKIISTNSDLIKNNPTIKLISNACMLIQWNGKNILTDPWIIGPAIYGAWVHYPPIKLDIKDIPKIDFILISHEHSDHFNEQTLSLLDKDTPIYFPNYKMDRLEKRIRKLGFSNIFSPQSEKITNLTDDIKLIFFNSNGMWNDSIIYLQLGNFKILNVNDAGFNWNIPRLIGNVDLLCSAFSFGASAYPLNWTHLKKSEKIEIMKTKNLGMLKMLKQIINMCNPKYLLPFANFNELGPTKLRKFAKMQIKNTPKTVTEFFQHDNTVVLEMFPGESWNGKTEKITKRQDHNQLFDRNNTIKFLDSNYYPETDQQYIPKIFTIEHNTIKKYFEDFSNSGISKTVGTYSVILRSYGEKRELIGKISFENGSINYEIEPKTLESDMTMNCPGPIVQDIIENDLSWDEIQYWSEYSRKNNEYNIGFWKIMHSPWEARVNKTNKLKLPKEKISSTNKNTAIATLIEKGGNDLNRIFEQFGLYCSSCDAAVGETIEEGCKMHGLDNNSRTKLISEINKFLKEKSAHKE